MNHNPCSGCGSQFCPGECYSQCEADFEPLEEAPRILKYVPSLEYVRWCAEADSRRTTVVHSDPLLKRGVA